MRIAMFSMLALAACGQPGGAGGEAAAQGAGGEGAYIEACVARYVAQSAQASRWAPDQCAQDWQRVVAAGPMADAILAAVRGTMPRPGRMGADVEVAVDGRTVRFGWAQAGALIPYDVVGALAERSAPASMIGCSQLGGGEFNKAYRVTPPGSAAFQLNIYERTAPTGDASSFYSAAADLSGRVQTRAQLASDGTEWTAACAY
jgi:hypothetical protein